MKITLYIATHNKTGLKYFGKTTRYFTTQELQSKYHGSGTYWKRHLKKHGDDVTIEIYGIYNIDEVNEVALRYSEENNIVKSKEYANLIIENGLDGGKQTDEITKRIIANTDRESAEKKRQKTNMIKYGGKSPSCNKEISKKRVEKLKEKKPSGLTGFEENGIKISKALKGKVSCLNIKNMIKFRNVVDDDYRNCWYLLGQTAKFILLYEIDDMLFSKEGLKSIKNINIEDYKRMRTNKPFRNKSFSVTEIYANFKYYSSIIDINS